MAFTFNASTAQQIGGFASSILGTVQTLQAGFQQAKAARDVIKAAEKEAQATMNEGETMAQNAQRRAWATLQDLSFFNAQRDANERLLESEGMRAEGHILAQAAGSGLALVGSPLLAAAEASLETGRAIGNQELSRQIGTRQLKFAAEQELERAQEARTAAKTQAEATIGLRTAQAGQLQQKSTSSLVTGIQSVGSILQTATKPYK